ncbi:SMI1/KNR4 family protein [Apibacter sp. HY039]|uniref:SMI1/KNR4 family protein n=1 Tax=Apibacter sp. HY039 TaxID=2501476 RepID=UPI000FEBA513|nr:SMI1/KNR4 family protein [Apibacter sp. HY039]
MNKLNSLNKVDKSTNEKILKQLELDLGFIIYSDFKEVLINYNVAKPLYSYYKKDKIIFNLDYLLGFSSKEFEDFKSVYNIYLRRMPENMIPIGIIDGADLLCMDNKTGGIYYWFHEEDDWGLEGNEKYPAQVGNSLQELLELLILNEKPTKEELDKVEKEGKTIYTSDDFDDLFSDYKIKK